MQNGKKTDVQVFFLIHSSRRVVSAAAVVVVAFIHFQMQTRISNTTKYFTFNPDTHTHTHIWNEAMVNDGECVIKYNTRKTHTKFNEKIDLFHSDIPFSLSSFQFIPKPLNCSCFFVRKFLGFELCITTILASKISQFALLVKVKVKS